MSIPDSHRILLLDVDPSSASNASFHVPEPDEDIQTLLASKAFDAVLASVDSFNAVDRHQADQQACLILNTLGEGVLVADQAGHVVWANTRMKAFTEDAVQRVLQICTRAIELFSQEGVVTDQTATPPVRKFSFPVAHGQYLELIVSPIIQASGQIEQVVAIVWDVTRVKRMEQKVNAIEAAGRELAKLESDRIAKLSPSQRLELLRDKIIKTSKDLLDFDHFSIRLADERTRKLEIVIAEGLPPEALEIELYAQPEGNGISGYTAATGRSHICCDTEKDSRYILGIEHCKSSLTVPLRLHDKIIGVFNVESESVGAFHEDDRQFAEIFGQYIAIALNTLNLLVVERCNTSGQISQCMVQEISEPLNQIVTDAKALMVQYIGDDHMRTKLQGIIGQVESVHAAVRDVARGTRTVLGSSHIKSAVADPLLAGKHILIADDEKNIRQTIHDILSKHGVICRLAKDGFEAIQHLEHHTFDLVLSDIRMPHRNGYEIFAAAQRLENTPPVILMTGFGYDPHHSIVRASQDGLNAVLFKPFKVDQMLEEVRKVFTSQPTSTPSQTEH